MKDAYWSIEVMRYWKNPKWINKAGSSGPGSLILRLKE
jgi:hypothetical protein